MKPLLIILCLAAPAFAVQIPAGTELSVRLTDHVSTDTASAAATTTGSAVHAVLIAPVMINGTVAIAPGATLTGKVKQSRAASSPAADNPDAAKGDTAKTAALLELSFTSLQDGAAKAAIATLVAGLDNSRESVDGKGVINGIAPDSTLSSEIDSGISKLEGNPKLAGLATLIQGAKQVLKIEDANPNIDYDPGVEFTLRVTQPFAWRGNGTGPIGKLQPIPNQDALPALVNRQPYRTVAQKPPNPSDLTNLLFIGTEEDLKAAFSKAGWTTAARLNTKSKLETARAVIEDRGYSEGPVSILLLEGRQPDMVWQKGNNTFAKRHHLRIFLRPDTFNGKPVWVCSSTHDIGINYSRRDRTFIHRVDGQIDRERAKVVDDLLFTGLVRGLAVVERPDVPKQISNATGDSLTTDGRMAVIVLSE